MGAEQAQEHVAPPSAVPTFLFTGFDEQCAATHQEQQAAHAGEVRGVLDDWVSHNPAHQTTAQLETDHTLLVTGSSILRPRMTASRAVSSAIDSR